jgi:autotransporter-associated beta strand protein
LPKINGTGGGTITLLGGNNLVAGITNSGLLDIQNSSTWDLNGIASSVAGLSGNGSIISSPGAAILTIDVPSFSGPYTYSGNIGGANVALVKQGDGTQTLSGNNSYQGDTSVIAGTLEVSNNTATTFHDGSTVSIASGAVLHLPNATTDQVRGLVIGGAPLDPGIYNASSSETAGFITGSGQLEVVASVGFADFMGEFLSLTEAEQLPDADPDHDGIANLIEYAIDGLSPVEANGAPGTLAGATLTFTKRAAAVTNDDVTYGFEDSLDLGAADPWAVVTLPNSHVTETAGIISYTFNHLTDGARAFIRLRVTQD